MTREERQAVSDAFGTLRERIAELEAALRPFTRYEQMDDEELAKVIKGTLFHQGCDKYEAKLIRAARQALRKLEPK